MHYLARVGTEVPPPATAWRMWPGWGGPASPAAAAAAAADKAQIKKKKKPTLSLSSRPFLTLSSRESGIRWSPTARLNNAINLTQSKFVYKTVNT